MKENKEIGIVLIATNAYFILGLRFIRRWMHFYKGDSNVKFYFFSDKDPKNYLPENSNVIWNKEDHHTTWREGTNSKFTNIIKLNSVNSNFLFYFDADTNIQKPFTEEWFLGDLVGGEHYSARTTLKNGVGFDRTPGFNSYVPLSSKIPYTYHYGAFFGGERERMIDMATTLRDWQYQDQRKNYEPPVNDESYINKYFHYNRHKIVPIEEFSFIVSDKGGLGNTRRMDIKFTSLEHSIEVNKDKLWDLQHGKLIFE